MMSAGVVRQISVSNGGVPKTAVAEARVEREGLVGDAHNDHRHGGPERAVCLFSMELIRRLRAEEHPIAPGTVGENLTVEGLDWALVRPGARLVVGDGDGVELEIVSYTTPCSTIRDSFAKLEFRRIKQEDHPGESRVYARVLREGLVRRGDPVKLRDTEAAVTHP